MISELLLWIGIFLADLALMALLFMVIGIIGWGIRFLINPKKAKEDWDK